MTEDDMKKAWEREYQKVREFPREKRQAAIDMLREELPKMGVRIDSIDMTWFELIGYLLELGGKGWVSYDLSHNLEKPEPGRIPMNFHFMGGGMALRNFLRSKGFGDDYFGVNLDYVYAGLLEEAVLGDGQRVTADAVEDDE